MTIEDEKRERRRKAVDYLETVDPARYDHGIWVSNRGRGFSGHLTLPFRRDVPECGTVACAAGWLAIAAANGKLDFPSDVFWNARKLADYLGVDSDVFYHAGYPDTEDERSVTLVDAIAAITEYGI